MAGSNPLPRTSILVICVFAAGATSLLFETIWFHQISIALGSTVWASSVVLSAYMLGMALGYGGAARFAGSSRSPGKVLALAHVALGASGVLLALLIPNLAPAFAGWAITEAGPSALSHALRFAMAFVLLIVPCTCMGLTLPLAVRLVREYHLPFGTNMGRLYGWEILGAVLGAIVTEHVLIGALGIYGTAMIGGAVHCAVAAGALVLEWQHRSAGTDFEIDPPARRVISTEHGPWLLAAGLSGFALLALEVVWFRSMAMFFPAQSEAFALMLAVVLSGLALGGFAAARVAISMAHCDRLIAPLAATGGLMSIAGYLLFVEVLDLSTVSIRVQELDVLEVGLVLMLPTSFVSGMLFTLIGNAIRDEEVSDPFALGTVGFANAVGSALGALVGGVALLPILGLERSFLFLALVYGIVAAVSLADRESRSRSAAVFGAVLLVAITLFPHGSLRARYVERALTAHGHDEEASRTFLEVGASGTVLYVEDQFLEEPHHYRMVTDAFSMSGTAWKARRYMKLYAYWPVAVKPQLKNALVIGFGVGSTTKALVDTPSIESIDVVDVSKAVLGMSRIVYGEGESNPLTDPRVQSIVEDGRFYLYGTDRHYDLITGEPPPPNTEGMSALYSQEYFELVYDRLAEGGIVTYWLPIHSLSDRSALSVLKAFCGAFEDCSLWHGMGPNLMMVGTRGLAEAAGLEAFARQWSWPAVAREMRSLGFERPEQIGALFIGGPDFLREQTLDVEPVRDAWPKRIVASPGATEEQIALYASWYDVGAAKARFQSSPLIARLWPEGLVEASLDYFSAQEIIQYYAASLNPDGRRVMDAVHRTITDSSLRAPVLWLLGSGADTQRIIEGASELERAEPRLQFHIGLSRLAERRYAAAAEALRIAQRDPELRRRAIAIRIFALCMKGRTAEAYALLEEERGPLGDADEYLTWLDEKFEIERE